MLQLHSQNRKAYRGFSVSIKPSSGEFTIAVTSLSSRLAATLISRMGQVKWNGRSQIKQVDPTSSFLNFLGGTGIHMSYSRNGLPRDRFVTVPVTGRPLCKIGTKHIQVHYQHLILHMRVRFRS